MTAVLLRTTAVQMAEDHERGFVDASPAVADLLDVLADRHTGCSADPASTFYCPELAAAARVASEYIGADAAKELTSA